MSNLTAEEIRYVLKKLDVATYTGLGDSQNGLYIAQKLMAVLQPRPVIDPPSPSAEGIAEVANASTQS